MFLLAGLGNPDQKYLKNRHNIGFLFLDFLKNETAYKKKFKGLYTETEINNQKIILLKPTTYMNLSGESLFEVKKFYKLNNNNIFVIHDDLDLEIGKIKVKNGGSSGGHNGIESISENIENNFNRIRIGIGHPGDKNLVESYVLKDFSKEELKKIEKSFLSIKNNLNLILLKKFDEFSSKVNNDI